MLNFMLCRCLVSMLRIANCSGFYGDQFAAMREMLKGGALDVLTGDNRVVTTTANILFNCYIAIWRPAAS
jgi:Acyclic terpene utilisation family protein AtuA